MHDMRQLLNKSCVLRNINIKESNEMKWNSLVIKMAIQNGHMQEKIKC
jgi:hypothetical protein